jgi:transcriptional regulator with XRE-family HTH domain
VQYRGRVPADTLSNRLVLARKLAGLTIDQAADAAGVKSSSLANWEQGMRPQRETDIVAAIAEAYDVDYHWLLFGGPLTPARGKPTKRVAGRAERSGAETATLLGLGEPPTSGSEKYPHQAGRPGDNRPKVRVESLRSMATTGPGRRAAPIR